MGHGRRLLGAGIAAILLAGIVPMSRAQTSQSPTLTINTLATLPPEQLDQLFAQASPGIVPTGQVPGRLLIWPGRAMAGPASQVSRTVWQGKNFHPEDSTVINRFFGLPMIKGQVKYEASWGDGAACHVLDYRQTSYVFRNVRDEFREVSPGLFLGKMYDVEPTPRVRRYFAFEGNRTVR